MKLKDKVLEILKSNSSEYISGQSMADSLNVTRNAVWKAVNTLKAEGYNISSVTNRGYILADDRDIISPAEIEKNVGIKVIYEKEVTSTNTVLKELAQKGERQDLLLIADKQTGGRGRMGRSFYSPAGTGVYFSVLLHPDMVFEDAALITTKAAVAAASAIEEVCNKRVLIKWVNDLYLNDKKICGILTEAQTDFESGTLQYVIIGIGINIQTPSGEFPKELEDKAAALFENGEKAIVKNALVSGTVKNIMSLLKDSGSGYLDEYRKRFYLKNCEIDIIKSSGKIRATAIGIDDRARLLVRYEDGSCDALSSGDVSIRKGEN